MNLLSLLSAPVAIVSTLVTALLLGLAAQRLLGIRLGPVRLLATGLFAATVLPLIGIAMTRIPRDAEGLPAEPWVETWFVLLAGMCTLLASMAFIVVVEAFAPLGSIPPATVWGRGLRGRWSRARRTGQVVGLALRHGLGPYLRRRSSRALEAPSSRGQLGRALRETLNACGATFVKMGQILSTRSDQLPPEMAAELAVLRDAAEPVPWADIERVLTDELGGPVESVFAEIHPTPLAAASIGQVHTARLHSGEDVVVKVQRPGIRPAVERDLDIAIRLGARLERTTEWGRSLGTRSLAEGLGAAIREELDYRIEADNIRTVTAAQPAGSPVRAPQPYDELSTERVLVMERLHGRPVSDAGPLLERLGLDRDEVARTILDALLRQVLVEGVFHADPHAGNIFILDDGGVGLLDLGSVGRLDGSLRAALERLLLGFDRGDPLAVTDALLELAPASDQIDEERLEREIGRVIARYAGGAGTQGAQMFGQLFTVVSRYGLEVPPEIAAVFRSMATAEGTLRQLAPGFDLVGQSKDLAGGYVSDRLTPAELRHSASEELVTLLPILRRLPRRIERIAGAAEHGRLGVNARIFADERDRSWITRLLHDVLVTVLAGVIGLMAVVLLWSDGGPVVRDSVHLHSLIGYNLLVVSAILALRVLVQVFRRRPGHDRL
ncbi:AarF/UbiB family protein [Georgenia halophila]|uniref:AarF/UbiB family protein n=1 Tax=Georgenia halophila TaxID=620889 RepID=A0ABP8LAJ8_9MICO